MRGSRTLPALALWTTLAVPAMGQETKPISTVPVVVTQSAVIDLRAAPPAALATPAEQKPEESLPAPLPRPRDRARAVPPGPREPSVAAPARAVQPLGPSPAITESFLALPDNNTRIPPDTYGAVGPNHLVVSLNTQLRIQNRDGSLAVADRTLNGFWAPVGGGSGVFDPRTVYDPFADRWISAACDDSRSANASILIGATRTGDPTGVWDLYRLDVDAGDALWADFTTVGFNNKWIVVQVNMFTFADAWVGSNIYVFDRAALYAGAPTVRLGQVANGFTQFPALTYDMSQDDLYLVEEWDGSLGELRLLKLSGPIGSEVLSLVGFPLGASTWQFNPPVADHAPQNDPQRIATNDARIQSVVYRNGSLWTTHTVFFPSPGPLGRASVQWWQLDPTTAGVVQNGLIDDPAGTNFYAFPSIAVNKLDDVLLGFSCFAPTRFASACYAFRKASDAPNTFEDVATLREGLAKYYKIFTGSVNRWGDYSATQVDPVNDVDFWTIQEYADLPSGTDRWGTWWGHLAPPPDITIDDVSLAEGNSGTTNARFTVSLSFTSTQTVEVDWVAADGTATLADGDFAPASGVVSFPPGTTSQFVDVPVLGDVKFEPNETFVVNLSSPLLGVIADAQGQGTILNDDALPQMSIDDVRVVEGNVGTTSAIFTVRLSNPSASPASASWSTSDGSAVAPGDYAATSGTVSFVPGDTSETLTVLVAGDVAPETDETFHVDLASPAGASLAKNRGVGTILDDDGGAHPGVTSFTVVSDGGAAAASGHNRLQWVNPVGGNPAEMRIRFTRGLLCTPPTDPDATYDGLISFAPSGAPGEVRSLDHAGLDLDTSYCYTFWVIHTDLIASAGASGIGRPFNATGNVKWKYATGTGTTGVAPPTVGLEGVYAVDNSGDLHAMTRSATGGPWPAGPPLWNPSDFGSPSQARNPIVPLSVGSRVFIATQDGRAHAVDTQSGAVTWSTALAPATMTGAPAGVFTAFGGEHDAIFVGTSAADDNVLHALDPATGAPIASFGFPANPGIGPILGMAVVDYSRSPQNRVYFASRQGSAAETLWCLQLGPPGPLGFSLLWKVDLGNISGSPVLRNRRIYVGTDAGEVKSVRADDGLDVRTIALGDGAVKGFVFPDRASGDVYASTSTTVWRLTDTGASWVNRWGVAVPNPSPPLLWPGTTHVFVGGGDGKIYQLETPGGALRSIQLDYDPLVFVVGAPSLDIDFDLVHVGSERGTFYAVQVPLP